MLNQIRQRYNKALGKPQNNDQKLKTIELSRKLKNMQKHPGWIDLHEWIDIQKEGARDVMKIEFSHIGLITIPRFFNSFLRYFFIVLEIRAYDKIDNYIRISIQRGDKYAEELAKRESRSTGKEETV